MPRTRTIRDEVLHEAQPADDVQTDVQNNVDDVNNVNDVNNVDDVNNDSNVVDDEVDVFSQFADAVTVEKDRDDVIRELLASGNAKRMNNLTVRNVVATQYDTHALLTFVAKEYVIGDVRDMNDVDAFGQPKVKLGKTHNIQSSSYAVAGVMKDNPKLAVFAADVIEHPDKANKLFAGARIDVLMQFVPKGTEYVNPFGSTQTATVFDRDKVIHHIVRLELGEVGRDMYQAMLLK